MVTPLQGILRTATRPINGPYNVLSFPTHERYQTGLTDTNAKYYLWQGQGIKDWNFNYGQLPTNHILLNSKLGNNQLPDWIDIDFVLSQNKFGQFQVAHQLAQQLHVPLISLEHTLPQPNWTQAQIAQLKQMKGNINLFISEFSREKWGWSKDEADIIHHGVDTNLFCPCDCECHTQIGVDCFTGCCSPTQRKNHILSVVNDWVNRDWCCGYKLWVQVTEGLSIHPVGDTPGLSKPAASIAELVKEYQTARIFINTSLVSPIPTALLEAMSCGMACISTATCMIPEIITHGENGLLGNTPQELRQHCEMLLKNPELCGKLGQAARQTVVEKFAMSNFVSNWNNILDQADKIVYIGE